MSNVFDNSWKSKVSMSVTVSHCFLVFHTVSWCFTLFFNLFSIEFVANHALLVALNLS